ncbi:uncharacterized protein BYT42DRAFT_572394 [Radiomyces spectabilis]|uniref:uncharacterized protein n=1 Tax=Radiomyces spectabilis TaxID=64574 RepID=UPI0022208972|nr:uncharacterized protein BYT42DRAFT_572394 [Radiomyces spectabilis]KAI8377992.1 hypothetical protein BYT42DRAFT_572394 [Radiomyces spectabilis]
MQAYYCDTERSHGVANTVVSRSSLSPPKTIQLPAISTLTINRPLPHAQLAPIHFSPADKTKSFNSSYPFNSKPSMTRITSRTAASDKMHHQFVCSYVDPVTGRTCHQSFRRSYDLSRHQTIHQQNRPLCRCDHCGKKFTRLDALRRHERVQGHFSATTRVERSMKITKLCSP